MTRKFIFIVAIAMIAFAANSQILWKISGKGLEHDSYVMGTHHVAPLWMLDSIAGFNEAFSSCVQVFGEVEMEEAGIEMAVRMQKYMMAPKDSLLTSLYDKEDLRVLETGVRKYFNVPVEQVAMLKPAVLMTQVAVMLSAEAFEGFNPEKPIDGVIQEMAKEQNKAVNGFETAEEQLHLLFDTPIAEQADDLLAMFKEEQKYIDFSRRLADLYVTQDLNGLYEVMLDPEFGMTEAEVAVLMENRNERWMEQLKSILPKKATFIVVGAGHLPGEKGLLSLLQEEGYEVTPVR